MADDGYYIYAISKQLSSDNLARLCLEQIGIDEKNVLEFRTFQDLHAFMSKVPLIEFGEAFKDKINDRDWLERKVRAHDTIVRFLSGGETIVPVRFGTVFRSDEAVENFIRENYDRLNDLLRSIDGCCEMGVAIYFDKPLLFDYLRKEDYEIGLLQQKLSTSTPGAGYMIGKKLDQLLESKFNRLVDKELDELGQRLSSISKVIKQSPLNPDRNNDAVLYSNVACLVPVLDIEEFNLSIKQLMKLPQIIGKTMRTTGPWPAYSFSRFAEPDPNQRQAQYAS
jgi:hypothetical protein